MEHGIKRGECSGHSSYTAELELLFSATLKPGLSKKSSYCCVHCREFGLTGVQKFGRGETLGIQAQATQVNHSFFHLT